MADPNAVLNDLRLDRLNVLLDRVASVSEKMKHMQVNVEVLSDRLGKVAELANRLVISFMVLAGVPRGHGLSAARHSTLDLLGAHSPSTKSKDKGPSVRHVVDTGKWPSALINNIRVAETYVKKAFPELGAHIKKIVPTLLPPGVLGETRFGSQNIKLNAKHFEKNPSLPALVNTIAHEAMHRRDMDLGRMTPEGYKKNPRFWESRAHAVGALAEAQFAGKPLSSATSSYHEDMNTLGGRYSGAYSGRGADKFAKAIDFLGMATGNKSSSGPGNLNPRLHPTGDGLGIPLGPVSGRGNLPPPPPSLLNKMFDGDSWRRGGRWVKETFVQDKNNVFSWLKSKAPDQAALQHMGHRATMAGFGGAGAGMALLGQASPSAFKTLTNSFGLLAAVVGQSLIPYAAKLSYYLQAAASWFYYASDATKQLVGRVIVWGTAAMMVTGVISTIVGALGLFNASLLLIPAALIGVSLALEKLAADALKKHDEIMNPKQTRAEYESSREFKKIQAMKDAGASEQDINKQILRMKREAADDQESAQDKYNRYLSGEGQRRGFGDRFRESFLGTDLTAERASKDTAVGRDLQEANDRHRRLALMEAEFGSGKIKFKGDKKDDLFSKFLSSYGNQAQPSYSSIDESYKKIQLSALSRDPLEALKDIVQQQGNTAHQDAVNTQQAFLESGRNQQPAFTRK